MYMMSLISGSVLDTLAPRITSGNTIYLTKSDGIGQITVNLNPVITTGQTGSFSIAPAFTTGATNENMSLNTATGIVSGTPGHLTRTAHHPILLPLTMQQQVVLLVLL
jgi:hypothetical protein